MNSAPIGFIVFPVLVAVIPAALMLAAAGAQPNQASGFRIKIEMTVSCIDTLRSQNLPEAVIMYKFETCMPPQAPGVNLA